MESVTQPEAEGPGHKRDRSRLRVYQQWQGNERFFCNGYLVAGPNWKSAVGSAFLVAAPSAVFCALVAPYLSAELNYSILVFSVIIPIISLTWLMMTACVDPGILPRQPPDEEFLTGRKPRTMELLVSGQRVVVRYNDTCHFYQPPRAHHCSVNDNCIERFDHHCPWVGTTIGLRNYRTFLLFTYTTSVLCVYVCAWSVVALTMKTDEIYAQRQAAGEDTSNLWTKTVSALPVGPAAVVLVLYTALFFLFVGGLAVFHGYLVATNQTTYENFRYNNSSRPNPYDRGCWANCAEVWCTRLPPSRINFRAYADEEPRPPPPQMPYPVYAADGSAATSDAPQLAAQGPPLHSRGAAFSSAAPKDFGQSAQQPAAGVANRTASSTPSASAPPARSAPEAQPMQQGAAHGVQLQPQPQRQPLQPILRAPSLGAQPANGPQAPHT